MLRKCGRIKLLGFSLNREADYNDQSVDGQGSKIGNSSSQIHVAAWPSADTSSSGLTMFAKATLPLASFAQSLGLGALVYLPNIYMELFGGSTTLIGIFSIIVVPFDIVVSPMVGHFSDAGFFNRGCFRDVEYWGRRAPLMLTSLPILSVTLFLSMVGPESLGNSVAVAVWYGVIRFAVALGGSMFEAAYMAGFTELFPGQEERARLSIFRFVAGLAGGGVGTVGIGTTALSFESKDRGSSKQQILFIIFGIILGSAWLMAIPYARIQTRTIMKKVESVQTSTWSALKEVWQKSNSFRCFAFSLHLWNGAISLLIFGLPLYCKHVLGFTGSEASQTVQLIIVGTVGSIPFATPLILYLKRRVEPSKMAGIGGLLCVVISPCHLNAIYVVVDYWPRVIQQVIICGSGLGTAIVAWTLVNAILFKRIVDEDQVRRAEEKAVLNKRVVSADEIPARRDGILNCFRTGFAITGLAWPGVLQLVLGLSGYDAEQDTQPELVRTLLLYTYTAFIPLMFAAFALPMLLYPMRGETWHALMTKYDKLYHTLTDDKA